MPRYDDRDRNGGTRLYVGHLSSRTRSRDLEDIFSRYGRFLGFCQTWWSMPYYFWKTHLRRVQDVDMKRDYAFIEFRDPRDADDARYRLNGREFDGSRIIVEVAKGVPRGSGGSGGSREYLGRGPPPGSGRCFNCGLDGHWARDCKAGDWKNKCYRCGDRGHIERNCKNSPKKLRPGRSYSRSPTPRHGSHSRSYSRSRSPVKRSRSLERRSRSPRDSQSPSRRISSPPPSKRRNIRATPDERSPRKKDSLSPRDHRSDYSASPKGRSCSPVNSADRENGDERYSSPAEENGPSTCPSPTHKDDRSPNYDDDDDGNNGSPGGLA